MKRIGTGLMALLLVAALLSGCGGKTVYTRFSDMKYERPDMTELYDTLDAALTAAEGEDLYEILDGVNAFYDVYDWFYTCRNLADIHYCQDLTDIYWEEEYLFCAENTAAVDAALEELYYGLAASPCRTELEQDDYFGAGFFDYYEGESYWNETLEELMEEEVRLQNRYYELTSQAADLEWGTEAYYEEVGREMAELLAGLIGLRQEIAAAWGYDDYLQYAADCYGRDYTTDQAAGYLEDIRRELVPLYLTLSGDMWDVAREYCTEKETFEYVRSMAGNMGSSVEDAFELLNGAKLYDISYGENKYDGAYEIYLWSYLSPFILMQPGEYQYDKLTFAHEFGHFCNDYASWGSYAGSDVTEIFSQGMEYLSLRYAKDGEKLTRMKMADCLSTYVEQAAYAAFEQKMYQLPPERQTADDLRALYEEVALDFGFAELGYLDWEFVQTPHFYLEPMYVLSYVVSNDAALQLYQMELEEAGAGVAWMEENLDTQCCYFLEFVEESGLESPFAEGRIESVRRTLEAELKDQ